ncbi:hypothetical protein GCM10023321_25910 [Pseudonocardia eucalypti]|uniref:Resolvase/invertase-type recombinase catalytic domain-containing protein n=1 Tax=Pseudonocardia eucalypti TaxID=648755 RepID=A0ABP9PYM0_9PSEU|nr:DNA invertase Pin-like site-specific DNA recombinase [Pseudonocardia eucalypti]
MLIGYARVSTHDQTLDLQQDDLTKAGCERIFTDTASGSTTERPGLTQALSFARPGDTVVVWRLDRLGSLRHLIDTLNGLSERGVEFRSLREHLGTATSGGKLVFHLMGALAEFERGEDQKYVHHARHVIDQASADDTVSGDERSGATVERAQTVAAQAATTRWLLSAGARQGQEVLLLLRNYLDWMRITVIPQAEQLTT